VIKTEISSDGRIETGESRLDLSLEPDTRHHATLIDENRLTRIEAIEVQRADVVLDHGIDSSISPLGKHFSLHGLHSAQQSFDGLSFEPHLL